MYDFIHDPGTGREGQWWIPKTVMDGKVGNSASVRNASPSGQVSSRRRTGGGSKWEPRTHCLDAAGDSVAWLWGVAPPYPTWQLLSEETPTPTSGFRTAGQATSGSAMAGFPGLERKFRRGR